MLPNRPFIGRPRRSDVQIVNDIMLEDINNILNAGDVPNLYAPEDMDAIMSTCRFVIPPRLMDEGRPLQILPGVLVRHPPHELQQRLDIEYPRLRGTRTPTLPYMFPILLKLPLPNF